MLTDNIEEPSSSVMTQPFLWSLLLFGPFAIALLCYIWAFCSQSHKLRDFREFIVLYSKCRSTELRRAQNTYNAALSLLLFDGFTIITGIVWGTLIFFDYAEGASGIVYVIWLGFRFLSVCQHLIVALISILYVSRPKWGAGLRTISRILNAVPFVLMVLSFIYPGFLIGLDICNFLLMLAIVVSCCLLETSPMAEQRKPFVLLSVSLFLLTCVPNAVMYCLIAYSEDYSVYLWDVFIITNLYIVMDGLLFYLVLKIKDEGQFGNEHEGATRSV